MEKSPLVYYEAYNISANLIQVIENLYNKATRHL